MGKTDQREQMKYAIYCDIAQIILLRQIKLGADACIEPDVGRKICEDITAKIISYMTPLEVLLHFLQTKGYVEFVFRRITHEYYKYEFTAFKDGGLQSFRRAPEDGTDKIIRFQGKTKEEAVTNAVTAEGTGERGIIEA